MSKVLTDRELAEIVSRTINDDWYMIDDGDIYRYFVEDLAKLIAYYGGADVVSVSDDGTGHPNRDSSFDEDRICVHFRANSSTPSDGGVFAHYDNDQPIEEWMGEYADN